MTGNDLDTQRSQRRAATMAAEARLASKQLGIEASPSLSSRPSAAKPSRIESMRAALGLNKLTSGISKKESSSSVGATAAATAAVNTSPPPPPAAGGSSGGWTVDGPGAGQGASPFGAPRSLRSQYSNAGTPPASGGSRRFTGDIEAPAPDAKTSSPWGKMFGKK